MSAWHRFRALNTSDRRAIAEAAALLCGARFGLALLSYRTLRSWLGCLTAACCPATQPVDRIVWAIRAAAARLPFHTTCVVQALAADTMLRRRGHASDVRFGVRTARPGRSGIEAHAWLDLAGTAVLGQPDPLDDYLEMSRP